MLSNYWLGIHLFKWCVDKGQGKKKCFENKAGKYTGSNSCVIKLVRLCASLSRDRRCGSTVLRCCGGRLGNFHFIPRARWERLLSQNHHIAFARQTWRNAAIHQMRLETCLIDAVQMSEENKWSYCAGRTAHLKLSVIWFTRRNILWMQTIN